MYFISSRSVLFSCDKVQNGIYEWREILNLVYPIKLKKWFNWLTHLSPAGMQLPAEHPCIWFITEHLEEDLNSCFPGMKDLRKYDFYLTI